MERWEGGFLLLIFFDRYITITADLSVMKKISWQELALRKLEGRKVYWRDSCGVETLQGDVGEFDIVPGGDGIFYLEDGNQCISMESEGSPWELPDGTLEIHFPCGAIIIKPIPIDFSNQIAIAE
ncbi:MAG: hypothetical protein FJY98_02815 [Candidatus Liptonbacteria bacterium]|nr:hypothetical protein [Candidatus Liptonbacteria bacterium]